MLTILASLRTTARALRRTQASITWHLVEVHHVPSGWPAGAGFPAAG